jgi:hypothetical protein
VNYIFLAASAHAIREVGPLIRSAHRNAPSVRGVLLIYPKDRSRPELLRLRKGFPLLSVWVAPKITRRLQKPLLWLAARLGLQRRSYVRTAAPFRRLVRGCLHITLERFFSALDFLETNLGPEDSLMVSDGRDVVLQSDPFERIGQDLVTGQEEKQMRDCPTNFGWLTDLYEKGVAEELAARPILCSGVSLGRREAVRGYLVAMAEEIWRCFPCIGPRGYFDQAVHNRIIHGGRYPARTTLSDQGHIATLGLMNPDRVSWDAARNRLEVCRKVPAIVHQYDRHPSLTEKIVAHH